MDSDFRIPPNREDPNRRARLRIPDTMVGAARLFQVLSGTNGTLPMTQPALGSVAAGPVVCSVSAPALSRAWSPAAGSGCRGCP
jgi:hypothetical protein